MQYILYHRVESRAHLQSYHIITSHKTHHFAYLDTTTTTEPPSTTITTTQELLETTTTSTESADSLTELPSAAVVSVGQSECPNCQCECQPGSQSDASRGGDGENTTEETSSVVPTFGRVKHQEQQQLLLQPD